MENQLKLKLKYKDNISILNLDNILDDIRVEFKIIDEIETNDINKSLREIDKKTYENQDEFSIITCKNKKSFKVKRDDGKHSINTLRQLIYNKYLSIGIFDYEVEESECENKTAYCIELDMQSLYESYLLINDKEYNLTTIYTLYNILDCENLTKDIKIYKVDNKLIVLTGEMSNDIYEWN